MRAVLGKKLLAVAVAAALVAGFVIVSATPAEAAVPNGVVVEGTAAIAQETYATLSMTVRPWQIFGQPLGMGTISGTYYYSSMSKVTVEGSCLFGLVWGLRTTQTPKRTVTFTCMLLSMITNPVSKVPQLAPLTVTATDGPGGTFDFSQGGPSPEIEPDSIHVTFF